MILIGEVHTGLLRNSTALTAGASATLLGFKPGSPAQYGERPVRFARSPELLTGVDCALASIGAVPRGIGTVGSRASVIGGQILLSSSYATITPSGASRRLTWSHYLSRPGVIEVLGRVQARALCSGFLRAAIPPPTLDLGAVNARIIREVQTRPGLNRRSAFRAQSTRLRWAAIADSAETGNVVFALRRNGLRTVELHCGGEEPAELIALCEDLALHDWLLSTLLKLIDHSMIGAAPRREAIARLIPAMDFILHLWMPGVRLGEQAKAFWRALDQQAALSKQWQASVDRVRDQFSMATITRLLASHSFDHS
ncbi:hypothetical protein Rhe02_53490 [Rhizocola hellebori]|uniref:Uncharacterized protein n=1 Tax=Rhizocola hellebori TaxID=1392758 RepID=A0A8J3QCT6_9ACTN|nr:SCO2521 family protein [Rhizocola hellebori]GIH07282.1 hypothetical protein Rhe02_53490 [Rhizocola hellebori]